MSSKENAATSQLLEGQSLAGARGVVVNITASRSLKMKEVNEVMATVEEQVDADATVIFGAVFDESMGDEIRVTVVAARTGTDDIPFIAGASDDYSQYDQPAVFRNSRSSARVEAMMSSGMDRLEIPAFLRKQAD